MKLEIDLTWEPQNIGWNMTNKREKYLPNSPDPRMVTSSNITVKVTDEIWSKYVRIITHCLFIKGWM